MTLLRILLAALLVAGAARAEMDGGLAARLRDGGYVIYFRHADTDMGQRDRIDAAGDWTSCDPARMRQLSEEGRARARAIGAAIRAAGIPVGRVVASEYCRSTETARLMDLGPVHTTTRIFNTRAARFVGGRDRLVETAREVLATPPADGTNTVVVAHGNILRAVASVHLSQGGGAVFRPGPDGPELVAQVSADDWAELRNPHKPQ